MPESEPIVILCSTVEETRNPIPGSTRNIFCSDCGQELWLSPSSREIIEAHNGEAECMCSPCCIAYSLLNGGAAQPLTKSQKEELLAAEPVRGPLMIKRYESFLKGD